MTENINVESSVEDGCLFEKIELSCGPAESELASDRTPNSAGALGLV